MTATDARPHFTLGPFTQLVSAHDLDRFVETARPGDKMVYAHGLVEPRGETVFEDARGLASSGAFVLTVERRVGERYWIIHRTAAAAPTSHGRRARSSHGEALTSEGEPVTEAIYRHLRRAANLALPCPTNADLAKGAELNSPDAARFHLRKLADAGRITIENHGPCTRRIQVPGAGWTLPTAK